MSLVLCDTSLWISAIQFQGVPLKALRHAVSRDTLLTCRELEDEIVRVLENTFGHRPSAVHMQLEPMLENAVRVNLTGRISSVCRDPKDDFILDCAVSGHADLIVTGDKDFLSLESYEGIRILTARQYLDLTASATPDPVPAA